MKERSTRSRVRIQLSTLMESLEECCRKANIEFDEGKWSESQSNLDEHLSHHPALKDSVFRLYGDKLRRTLHKDGRFYDSGSLVVQRVHLLLDTSNWNPLLQLWGLFSGGVYFEECTIETERSTRALLGLGFARKITFRKTQFVSGADERTSPRGMGAVPEMWLVNLNEGSSISFEECNFRNDYIQIRAFGKTKEALGRMTQARWIQDQTGKEDKTEAAHTKTNSDILLPHNISGAHPLRRIQLLRNRQIGRLHIVSGTEELILRAGNHLATLGLPGSETTDLPWRVSLGLFEEIDPTCRDPLRHRGTFLQLRQLGTDTKDDALVRASTAQIDKIDHFLLKNDAVKLSDGIREYAGHFQRRTILGWGYWISNFNRSWGRCLGWLMVWYAGTTVLACCMAWPPLDSSDVASIVVRPLHQVPFLAKAIEEHLPQGWTSIPTTTKVGISLVGLVQTAVTGMLTFSLVRSLRR